MLSKTEILERIVMHVKEICNISVFQKQFRYFIISLRFGSSMDLLINSNHTHSSKIQQIGSGNKLVYLNYTFVLCTGTLYFTDLAGSTVIKVAERFCIFYS